MSSQNHLLQNRDKNDFSVHLFMEYFRATLWPLIFSHCIFTFHIRKEFAFSVICSTIQNERAPAVGNVCCFFRCAICLKFFKRNTHTLGFLSVECTRHYSVNICTGFSWNSSVQLKLNWLAIFDTTDEHVRLEYLIIFFEPNKNRLFKLFMLFSQENICLIY